MAECSWYEHTLGKTLVLTDHALDRKAERKVTKAEIVQTLKHGSQNNGTNKRCLGDVEVAFERDGNFVTVITVIRKSQRSVA